MNLTLTVHHQNKIDKMSNACIKVKLGYENFHFHFRSIFLQKSQIWKCSFKFPFLFAVENVNLHSHSIFLQSWKCSPYVVEQCTNHPRPRSLFMLKVYVESLCRKLWQPAQHLLSIPFLPSFSTLQNLVLLVLNWGLILRSF